MKTAIGLVLAFALTLSVVPAVASDTFHAFSTLPAAEQASLTPLSDVQLAAVEGEGLEIEVEDVNLQAVLVIAEQTNVAIKSKDVEQVNLIAVEQSID